jgi:divalent metal cation (Fe/Co/Zn/Cd) transporter
VAVPVGVELDSSTGRRRLVRRGLWLAYATVATVTAEAIAALVLGVRAHSVALVGFGADSGLELVSATAALWRLYVDRRAADRVRVERRTRRIIGAAFLALAGYIAADALYALAVRAIPRPSRLGLLVTIVSLVAMMRLAHAKRSVAAGLASRALRADAMQTTLCTYLSAIVLGGLALNVLLGWWWADPIAALALTPIIAREGINAVRGAVGDDMCC